MSFWSGLLEGMKLMYYGLQKHSKDWLVTTSHLPLDLRYLKKLLSAILEAEIEALPVYLHTSVLSCGTPRPIKFMMPAMYCDLMCPIQLDTLKMANATLASLM